MAVQCFSLLKPVVPQLMPAVIEHIQVEPDQDCVSVTNNAAWAMGELALQYQSDPSPLEPFVQGLVQRLVPILLNSKSPKSITENAAVTIGRLGMVCPAMVAPDLATFAQAWCTALWEIKDNDEKDSAFRGFCMMISANPAGIQDVSWGSADAAKTRADGPSRSSTSATPFASGSSPRSTSTTCSGSCCAASGISLARRGSSSSGSFRPQYVSV